MYRTIKNVLFLCYCITHTSIFLSMDLHEPIKLPGIDWNINPRVIKPEHAQLGITFVCHGFGGSGDLADYLANEKILDGTLITFEMADSTAQGNVPISQSSFGQKNDTKALAATMVYAYQRYKESPWSIYALSRGGAAAVNTLAQLICYDTYAAHLQSVNLTAELATAIVEKLKQGTIILDRPLHSVSSVVKNKVDTVLSSSLQDTTKSFSTNSYVPWFIKDIGSLFYASSRASIASSIDCVSLPIATHGNYTPFGDTPVNNAAIIKNKFNILVHIQNPDDVLGNDETVATFCKNLRGDHTYYYVATDIGHNGFNKKLINTFLDFCIYYKVYNDQTVSVEHKKTFIKDNGHLLKKLQPDDETLTTLVIRKS